MPSSATRTFTDPDMCFAGIRNLQIDGVITKRGEFRAKATRIDMHRLWMHRFDESLPRIMRITPSGKRSLISSRPIPISRRCRLAGSKHRTIKSQCSGWIGRTTFDPLRPVDGLPCR